MARAARRRRGRFGRGPGGATDRGGGGGGQAGVVALVGGEEGAAEAAAEAAQRGSGVGGCLGVLALAELEAPDGEEALAAALAEWREGSDAAGPEEMPASLLAELVAAHAALLEEQAQVQAQAEAEAKAEAEAASEPGVDSEAGATPAEEAEAETETEAASGESPPSFLYLVDGLGTGAGSGSRAAELVQAGLPLVAVVWVHKPVETPEPEAEADGDAAEKEESPAAAPEPEGKLALESARALGAWGGALAHVAAVEHTLFEAEAAGEDTEAESSVSLGQTVTAILAARATYSAWEEGATVFNVPAAGKCDLQLFRKLLEGVSPSLQTIPVIMHCLVEQVVRSSEDEEPSPSLQEPRQDSNDSILEILEGAFSSVTLEEVALSAASESDGVKVSYEATGKPVVCTGGSKFLDVEAVEKAIAQLEAPDTVGTGRRGMPDEPLLPASIKGTQQTLLASLCGDVALETVNRYRLLDFARQTIPVGVQEVHGAEVVGRRHVEALEPAVLAERLNQAREDFLDRQTKYFPEEDAVVVSCYAGTEEQRFEHGLPAAHSLSTYTSACLEQREEALQLPSRLYGLGKAVGVTESSSYYYPSNGSTAKVDTSGGVLVRLKGNTFSLRPDGTFSGHLSDGSYISVKPRPGDGGEAAEPDQSKMEFTIPEGMMVSFSSDGTVSALPCKELRDGEVSRSVIPGGTVLKHGAEGASPFIMFADGSTMHKADGQFSEPDGGTISSWFGVTRAGRKWETPLKFPDAPEAAQEEPAEGEGEQPLAEGEEEAAAGAEGEDGSGEVPEDSADSQERDEAAEEEPEEEAQPEPISLGAVSAATVVDPDTQARVTTRVDMVMIVENCDGPTIVTHADGTRVVTDDRQGTWEVESDGYLPIQGSKGRIQVGAASWEREESSLSYALPEQGELIISGDEVWCGQIRFALNAGVVEWLNADNEVELALSCTNDAESSTDEGGAAAAEDLPADGEGGQDADPEPEGAEQEGTEGDVTEEGAEAPPADDTDPGCSAEPEGGEEHLSEECNKSSICATQRPRIFIVYEDGHGYEYLNSEDFAEYMLMKADDSSCSISTEDVIGSREKSLSHFFLTSQEPRHLEVKALPVAPPVSVQQSLPPKSLKTLQLPSTVKPTELPTAVTMPRIAAPQTLDGKDKKLGSAKNVAMRQVLEYSAIENTHSIEDILKEFHKIQEKEASTTPESYKIEDSRTDEAKADEAEVALRIATLRKEKISSLGPPAGELHRGVDVDGGAAFSKEKKPYPTELDPYLGTPRRPSMGKTLNYFECEEGIVALKSGLPVVASEQPQASNDLAPAARTSKADETGSTEQSLDSEVLWKFFMSGKAALGGNVNSEEMGACDLENLIRGNMGFVELVKQSGRGAELDSLMMDLGADPEQSFHISQFVASILGNHFEESSPEQAEGEHGGREACNAGITIDDSPAAALQDWEPSYETDDQSLGYSTGRSTALNIYGKPRPPPSNIPKVHRTETAASEPNYRYIEVEAEARRHVKLSSTRNLGGATGYKRQFTLSPASMNFGSVKVGQSKTKTALLTNVSPELGRFKVKRPEAPFSVTYTPGFVVAGMKQKLQITFCPATEGEFRDEIMIETEFNIFYLAVTGGVASSSMLSQEPSLAGSFALPSSEEPSEPVLPKFQDIELDENKKLSEVVQN